VKRLLVYKPAAQRELAHMDRSDATRILHALEGFAADGRGDVKALKGALKGRYRLRIGKPSWQRVHGHQIEVRTGSKTQKPTPQGPSTGGSRSEMKWSPASIPHMRRKILRRYIQNRNNQ
jgi:hypothetical protein